MRIGHSRHFGHSSPSRRAAPRWCRLLLASAAAAAGSLGLALPAAAATGPARPDVPPLSPASASAAPLPSDASTVRIAMTEVDTGTVIVTSPGGVSAPGVPSAPAVLFQRASGAWNVWTATRCTGPAWHPGLTGVASPTASPATAGDLLTLCAGGTESTNDQGTITAVYNAVGQSRAVNTLPLEEYVADVVPGESPSYWGTLGGPGPQDHPWGFQELEAQAVAVRSYVLADLGGYGGYADTCDLTCQTYRGTKYVTAATIAAAQDTAGQVMVMPTGRIATTEYSASTGGYTSSATETSPFTPVADTGDGVCLTPPPAGFSKAAVCNPNHNWATTVALSAVAAHYGDPGTPTVTITRRNGHGTWGGRAVALAVTGKSVPAATFVATFGLRSNYFTIASVSTGALHLEGHGWGHGIGMGQWGALGYAIGTDNGNGNWKWQTIVAHYYGAATVQELPGSPTWGKPSGGVGGFWLSGSDGGIFSFGNAQFHGSMGGHPLNAPIVGMAPDPATGGYWEVASDGGIFAFTAPFYGSMGGHPLNQPVVGMAAKATGNGYWLVASDGGIFAFTAPFHGSMGGHPLNAPIVGMAPDPATGGYWEVASDGGIFAFTAPFYGSTAATAAGAGTVDLLATHTGAGYLIVGSGGHVTSFGDAPHLGDMSTVDPTYPGGIVAAATSAG